ncbi:hypothetical protein LMG27177_06816 [Paraburkholderia fynbosensis]|uniref:Uncharacterized protein n=1 Tax=Paraburkholderia fynbosensis TaxID=1200993 RepID=A0A6J5GZG6_9BURK|nr:hypothetical protein LMG27177_06816 [Paraburkholderia fynbosensis]
MSRNGYACDTISEPTTDLRSKIAAEARAKIVYVRLLNITGDPGINEALRFLMTREIARQKSFENALHTIHPNFSPSKLPGILDLQILTTTCRPAKTLPAPVE